MRSTIKQRAARWSFICVHQFNEESRLANLSKLPWSVRTPSNKTTSRCLPPTLSAVCSLHHFTINYCSITTSWLHCTHVEQNAKHNPLTKLFLLYILDLRKKYSGIKLHIMVNSLFLWKILVAIFHKWLIATVVFKMHYLFHEFLWWQLLQMQKKIKSGTNMKS